MATVTSVTGQRGDSGDRSAELEEEPEGDDRPPGPLDRRAALVYTVDTGEPLVTIPSTADGAPERSSGRFARREVWIRDARPRRAALSLDREGFALVEQRSAVTDFHDDVQLREIYEPELAAALRSALQGSAAIDAVLVFDHTRRAGAEALRRRLRAREPVQRVHNDYTPRSAAQRVRDVLGPAQAERRLRRRFAIINLWRSIAGVVLRAPLAVCDARSVAPAELLVSQRRAPERIGETFRVAHSPAHRWRYFPAMREDELLLIKSYDSATDGRARFTPHTAFEDPSSPDDAPPRQSLESRAFVFFAA